MFSFGLNDEELSLKDYNVKFDFVDLVDNDFNYDAIKNSRKGKIMSPIF